MSNFRWQQQPGKRTCQSSEGLHDQIRTLEGWEASVVPGSTFTACGGNCDCRLVPTDQAVTKNPFHVFSGSGDPVSISPAKTFADGSIRATIKNEADQLLAVTPDNKVVGGSTK
jgi:hypothetical protein